MSFKCDGCGEAQAPHRMPVKRRVKERSVTYVGSHEQNPKDRVYCRKEHRSHGQEAIPGGEVDLCLRCARQAPVRPEVVESDKEVPFTVRHFPRYRFPHTEEGD